MASEPIRDPAKDHLLTPKNSALIIIDYQPAQVNSIASMDRQRLIDNIVGVAKTGRAFGLPIVHSTINLKTSINKPPIPIHRRLCVVFPIPRRCSPGPAQAARLSGDCFFPHDSRPERRMWAQGAV